MSSNSSNKDKVLTSIAGPVAHPERYRRQFWMGGTFVVLAVLTYFLWGLLPLVLLVVVGGLATRYAMKRGRTPRRDHSY
jgi:hypothetical protein